MRLGMGATSRQRLRAGLVVLVAVKIVFAGVWLQSWLVGGATRAEAAAEQAAAVPKPVTVGSEVHLKAAAAGSSGVTHGPAKSAVGVGVDAKADSAKDDARIASAGPAVASERPEKVDVRALLDAVAKRNAELDAREQEVASREERLKIFEQDVTAKVASLEEIEKRLLARSKEASAAMDAAGESLAKIYGAMKPADAAPILDQLDDATVLMIFGRMKEKQVGEILPVMAREKAIVLTRALAQSR